MSAGPSRSSGSQAPRWAILPEPSPSAAPSDDDRASTQDMHDELDPTPPASQAQPRPTKKRKPDVPASEDERAARNKLLKKAKAPQDAGGGERERQVEPEPGPSLQPKGPMASPLDSVQPRRRQIAMKRVSRGRPFQLQFEFEKDVRASQPATPSALAPPAAKPTAASSKPPPATQPAPRDSSAFRMPRFLEKNSSLGDWLRSDPPASQPVGGSKGKEVDRSGVAGGSGARWLTKSNDKVAPVDSAAVRFGVPARPTQTGSATVQGPKAPTSTATSQKSVALPPTAGSVGLPKKSMGISVSTVKVGTGVATGSKSTLRPVATTSKATAAPLSQAKSKKRPFLDALYSSSDEGEGRAVPEKRSERKSLGLTKVPRPKPGASNAKTGKRASDSSVSAEEFPSKRKRKKIKLTHANKRADIGTANNLTATQQRRKAVVPRHVDVIELSSDSDKPEPPKAPVAVRAKQPHASAPAKNVDVINITDSEEEAPPPLKRTQSQPAIARKHDALKYDADGSILIDDDEEEEEPVAASASLVPPKAEKPTSAAARSQLTRAVSSQPQVVAQVIEQRERSIPHAEEESSNAHENSDEVAIEDQMQDLDLGNQEVAPLHDSPEAIEDDGSVDEREAELWSRCLALSSRVSALESLHKSATPSEDAQLALSTDTQLHITEEDHDEADDIIAAPQVPNVSMNDESRTSGLSDRAMEKAPVCLTRSPSFTTTFNPRREETDTEGKMRQTVSPDTSSPNPSVPPMPSKWITPLAPSIGKSSKTVYGGPNGFFKDVYASRRKSRSASQSVRETTAMSPIPSALKKNEDDVASPSPAPAVISSQVAVSSPTRDSPSAPDVLQIMGQVDPGRSASLELTYPSSKSSPSAHSAAPAQEAPDGVQAIDNDVASESVSTDGPEVEPDSVESAIPAASDAEPPHAEDPIQTDSSPGPTTLELLPATTAARTTKSGSPSQETDPPANSVADRPQQEAAVPAQGSSSTSQIEAESEVSKSPAPHFRARHQIGEYSSLTEVINRVWKERTQQVVDLTLDDDDDHGEPNDTHVTPASSNAEVTKEEVESPSVSTLVKGTTTAVDAPSAPDEIPSPGPSTESTIIAESELPSASFTAQQLSLDSVRLLRMRPKQKQESNLEKTAATSATNQASGEATSSATSSTSQRKRYSVDDGLATDEDSDRPRRGRHAGEVVEAQDESEGEAPFATRWPKRRRRERVARFEESEYGPPASPSPSHADDSEEEIASYLDDAEVEASDGQASSEVGPTRRQLRPRNKSGSTAPLGDSRDASRSRRSTRSSSSSDGPAELSDHFDPSFVEPRIASPSDEPEVELNALEEAARKAGFLSLSWKKDHRRMMKEFANYYVLAKDLPHELQDRINALGPRARREGDMQIKILEQAIIENTFEDEPHAPPIRIINQIDDEELTPPFEFHYSNLMWHGEGVPKPDAAKLQGCGCLGPCDPNSKTCECLARQKAYHEAGFLYHGGRNKGQLIQHNYPIFECNDFCGCSDDCVNRVVQHGRRYPIEIRKTRDKGWGVFAGPKRIPKNTYLGIYAGEYLLEAEAEARGHVYNKFGRTYLFDVDFWHLRQGKDEWNSQFSVDAYHAGNFTRYLNHSCDPNCCINPCYINEANLDKPLLTIFTQRDVAPGDELCFSYYGNDDEDDEDEDDKAQNAVEVRNFDDAVYVKCRCGAKNCKGRMWKE